MKFKINGKTVHLVNLKKGFDHDLFDMWYAQLVIDGKKIANFVPNGYGGADGIHLIDHTSESLEALRWFNQTADSIMAEFDFTEADSLLIEELIGMTLVYRTIKREMKKGVVFCKPDQDEGAYYVQKDCGLEMVKRQFPDGIFADDLGLDAFILHVCRDLETAKHVAKES